MKRKALLIVGAASLLVALLSSLWLLCCVPQRTVLVSRVEWKPKDGGYGLLQVQLSGWGHSPGAQFRFGKRSFFGSEPEPLPAWPGKFEKLLDIPTDGPNWRESCLFELGQELSLLPDQPLVLYQGTLEGETYRVLVWSKLPD